MGHDSVGDINPAISTWKGADADGEGLVQDESEITHSRDACNI